MYNVPFYKINPGEGREKYGNEVKILKYVLLFELLTYQGVIVYACMIILKRKSSCFPKFRPSKSEIGTTTMVWREKCVDDVCVLCVFSPGIWEDQQVELGRSTIGLLQ